MAKDKCTYVVREEKGVGNYSIRKYHDEDQNVNNYFDRYDVTLKWNTDTDDWDVWCSCMGFRRQKYDKMLHKHVQMVKLFIECAEGSVRLEPIAFKIKQKGRGEFKFINVPLPKEPENG